MLNERMIETMIEIQLSNLGWDISQSGDITRQTAKTAMQRKKLGALRPDFILYEKNSDKPLVVIEAKRGKKDLNKALDQGKKYANILSAPIVIATDGVFTKTLHTKKNKPLYLNNEEVDELIEYSLALSYINDNEFNSLDKRVIQSRDELISIFKQLNDEFRAAGVRAGTERTELFCNILFLKVIDELSAQDGSLIKTLPSWCRWDKIKNKNGDELLSFINGQAFEHFRLAYDGDVLSPIRNLQNPSILNRVIDKLDDLHLSSTNRDIKGDAFEYFLRNYGGAETDFGEYFTPRHIIKSLVKILDPKFGESIYDPFCGTGGMLINAFNHIYRRLDRNERNLEQLKTKTIYGGEITEMFRVAKMNMILTGDGHSNIQRQDSYKTKNTGKYDIVMTNIPFGARMTTKYSSQYGYNTASAEVTGVLHCLDALSDNENARAGIIVPEGILFKNSAAYKKLREQILEKHSLETIISLPTNTFAPNTGVKSNILIVKKKKNTKKDHVWYFNVKNDGYTLDANRKKIEGTSDLDIIVSENNPSKSEGQRLSQLGFSILDKDKIRNNNYSFIAAHYIENNSNKSQYEMVSLFDLLSYEQPQKYIVSDTTYNDNFNTPVLTPGKTFILGFTDDVMGIYDAKSNPIILFDDFTTSFRYINFKFKVKSSAVKILKIKEGKEALIEYVFYAMKGLKFDHSVHKRYWISEYSKLKIPLPPIHKQQEFIKKVQIGKNKIAKLKESISKIELDIEREIDLYWR